MNFWTGSGLNYGMFNMPGDSLMFQHSQISPGSIEGIGIALAVFAVIACVMFVALKADKTPRLND